MIEYTVRVCDNRTEWFFGGKRHRIDGPACEYSSGTKAWLLNGQLHRVDGPAIEYPSGFKSWFLNGKCHRVDGPAEEYTSGVKYWYIDGKKLTEKEFNSRRSPSSCEGKIVEIEGVKYKLSEVKNAS